MFPAPFGRSQRSGKMLRNKALGTRGKRQPYGLLSPKVAKQPAGGERKERRTRPAPAVTIERPGLCLKPRQARREASPLWHRREACALWALSPRRSQRDPQAGQRNHEHDRQGSSNDGATDDPPAPRTLAAIWVFSSATARRSHRRSRRPA